MNYKAWFESRGLRTLDYQLDILENKLPQSLAENQKPTVLAACPSAGKTLMSIAFIEAYLKDNPKHRVLVLTHGTTILRSQYYDVLIKTGPGFSFSNIEVGKDIKIADGQVIVTLPQTIRGVGGLSKFDLVIIDEAHHFYFAKDGMVQSIIEQVRPQHQLLLTGTPSPFILRGYPTISVAANRLLDYGMIEDPLIEIASSTYDLRNRDYNASYDLKGSVEFREADTRTTLDKLLQQIVYRVTSTVKNYPKLYAGMKNLTGWSAAFGALQKTMIVCKSQEQAKQVTNYFLEKEINVALSISDTDTGSDEIDRFKIDPQCLVLVVVARGILGFNYPELENVIDMTCSHNIDRIYQLLCRVIRKHPQGKKKLYFKVVPHYWEGYFRHVMDCVVCLTDEEYYTMYNGKNFLGLKIPVQKEKYVRREPKGEHKRTVKNKLEEVKPIDMAGLPAFSLFRDILHKSEGPLNPYAYTTMQDVRSLLLLDIRMNYWTKERCVESASEYNTRSEWGHSEDGWAYQLAWKNNWFEECCKHMVEIYKPDWTMVSCKESASKYNTRAEWKLGEMGAYSAAWRKYWLEECCKHMIEVRKPNRYWTKIRCMESASNYNTQLEWKLAESGAHSSAQHSGWLRECCKHMGGNKPHGYWTKELCTESAANYSTRSEWKVADGSAYTTAGRHGWREECCQHMRKRRKK